MAIVKELSGNGGIIQGNTADVAEVHMPHGIEGVDRSFPVTASDTNDLPNGVCEALIIGTGGALRVTYPNGTTDIINLPTGMHYIRVRRVWATGLTAANISAGY
ncbi:MAG: hypothetical protein IM561_09155 [Microcystis sp. M60BS1]|uniref:spike base protein, RCAP_Rcc01079 family n=1 Tax=unclassified Microcystis TaxID=2643300 RepID=UPI00257F159B|nr:MULTISPECIES: hypothetical protein [unclassified Microcystis]MCA2594392.1 hypothetical protein [Microcystis sp. M38BS1]MCA6581484.1 hypothetical protein [Pseudanabaena sp. M34BS1SP1A06MG]MCA2510537.1 hypothetical protein [Microcystis sp. M60BS1]MCA2555771.1 hypothetical protein [Microcystis sp. M43BS1]MCA2603400.1 hypothetical protein [Microcystis sp. M26BS1]